MENIKIMLIGNNDNKIFELKNLLKKEDVAIVGISRIADNALEKVSSVNPNIILVQCGDDLDASIALAERVHMEILGCSVIFLCDSLELNIIERAMLAGVRRVLLLPADANELMENISVAFNIEKSRRQNTKQVNAVMDSKVVSVFGAKGGIGKTTIAVNLASVLSQMGKRVALIDADLQFGDANVFFDIESKNTIAELSQAGEVSDIDAIKRISVLHQSGVSVLCAPRSPEFAEYVSPKNIETVINTMRPYYDYIIVDTAPLFNDTTVTAIENSNLVLLVSGIDISTLRNTKTSFNILESLQQLEKIELVVNKISESIITVKDVQRILERPVRNQIPFDLKTALTCHNKGVPIVLDAHRTPMARELKQLASNVISRIEKANS